MPVHVKTNLPMTEKDELVFIEKMNVAHGIVDQLKKTSPEVMRVIRALHEHIDDYQRFVSQSELKAQYEAALRQGGFSPRLAHKFSLMFAFNTVRDIDVVVAERGDRTIDVVVAERGDSIVVHFLCKTVKALYELDQMIVSGFMHAAVFAAAVESLAHTAVDVNVRADEFNLRLLQQEKGNSVDR